MHNSLSSVECLIIYSETPFSLDHTDIYHGGADPCQCIFVKQLCSEHWPQLPYHLLGRSVWCILIPPPPLISPSSCSMLGSHAAPDQTSKQTQQQWKWFTRRDSSGLGERWAEILLTLWVSSISSWWYKRPLRTALLRRNSIWLQRGYSPPTPVHISPCTSSSRHGLVSVWP